MSRNDMLGKAVQDLVALPDEALGVAGDILAKLHLPHYRQEGALFARKEPCWVPSEKQAVQPAEPLYLADTGSRHPMPAGSELDVEAWVESLPKYDQGSNFRGLVKGRFEKDVPAGQLRQFRNTRGGNGAEIVKEIKTVHGGKYSCFADIKAFIESGAAKKDGTWYAFLLEIDGQEWLVGFGWLGGRRKQGWGLGADRPGVYDFSADGQFLFRDSVAA